MSTVIRQPLPFFCSMQTQEPKLGEETYVCLYETFQAAKFFTDCDTLVRSKGWSEAVATPVSSRAMITYSGAYVLILVQPIVQIISPLTVKISRHFVVRGAGASSAPLWPKSCSLSHHLRAMTVMHVDIQLVSILGTFA